MLVISSRCVLKAIRERNTVSVYAIEISTMALNMFIFGSIELSRLIHLVVYHAVCLVMLQRAPELARSSAERNSQ
jgi:hypothetical protein